MNRYQQRVVKLAKLEMKIDNISFYKANKKSRIAFKGIRNMLIKRYGFNK